MWMKIKTFLIYSLFKTKIRDKKYIIKNSDTYWKYISNPLQKSLQTTLSPYIILYCPYTVQTKKGTFCEYLNKYVDYKECGVD